MIPKSQKEMAVYVNMFSNPSSSKGKNTHSIQRTVINEHTNSNGSKGNHTKPNGGKRK